MKKPELKDDAKSLVAAAVDVLRNSAQSNLLNAIQQAEEEAKEVLKQYDEANLGKEQTGPYESLIMAKAREDVAKFQAVRAEIQKRLDTADHIPIEILNDYERLIQAAGR